MMGQLSAVFLTLAMASLTAIAQEEDDGDRKIWSTDEVIAVTEVPGFVMSSLQKEMPNVYVTQVTRQVRNDDSTRYRIDASQVGRYWVLVFRDDGEMLEKYESSGPPALGPDAS